MPVYPAKRPGTMSSWLPASVALIAVLSCPVAGQEVRTISNEATCEGCAVEIREIARIGGAVEAQAVALLTRTNLSLDSRGRFFAAPVGSPTAVSIFGPTGRHEDTMDREGDGPGEFRRVTGVAMGPGDSIYVVDQNWRINVFARPFDFTRIHALSLGLVIEVLPLRDGRLAANVRGLRAPPVPPVQVVDAEGLVLSTGGKSTRGSRRHLARGPAGSFWAAASAEYVLFGFDERGRSRVRLHRDAEWFVPSSERSRGLLGFGRGRFSYWVEDLESDADGRLWVLLQREDHEWEAPAREDRMTSPEGGGYYLDIEEMPLQYRWFIEVIDPDAGELLRRIELKGRYVGGLLPGGRFYQYEEDEGGWIVIRVFEILLESGPDPRPH